MPCLNSSNKSKHLNDTDALMDSTYHKSKYGVNTSIEPHMESARIQSDKNHFTSEMTVDDFDIIKVVGRGSFGKVYLVKKRDNGEFFAMKTLKKDVILRKN